MSKEKIRYVQDTFDLDLTYITKRIIAMGYPSENLEAWYRNSITEVRRFMNKKHPDHHKIYNLCSERKYDPRNFNRGLVCEDFAFDDHNPPEFNMIF